MRFGSKRRERAAIEPSPSWSKEPRSVTAESQPRPAVLQRASRVTAAQNMRASERRPFANLGFVLGLPELLEEGFDVLESRCQHDVAASQVVFDDVVILESRQVIVD